MIWLTICGMACITYLNRFAFLIQSFKYAPSESVRRMLAFSSLAVLTAIWTPIVFSFDASSGFSISGWDYLLAGLLAVILCLFRLPSLFVVITSTLVFFLLRFIL